MHINPQEAPQLALTLIITSRCCHKKFVFTLANDNQPLYYILAPPRYNPKRFSSGWTAIVHAGDNPKHHPLSQSPVIGRCKRTAFWRKIYIEYGGSVQRDVKIDEKRIKQAKLEKKSWFRKLSRKGPKELEWSEEDEAVVSGSEKGVDQGADQGGTSVLEMTHRGHRKYEFSVDGKSYRWTGTRMHAGNFITWLGLKGIASHVKLVQMDNHKLVASFKKAHFGKDGKFGELYIYADEQEATLDEALLVQTAFCMVKSEKSKRDQSRHMSGGGAFCP